MGGMASQQQHCRISVQKAKAAVRRAFEDHRDAIQKVAAISGFADKVRFARQLEDLDWLYDEIMRRMDRVREPARVKEEPAETGEDQD